MFVVVAVIQTIEPVMKQPLLRYLASFVAHSALSPAQANQAIVCHCCYLLIQPGLVALDSSIVIALCGIPHPNRLLLAWALAPYVRRPSDSVEF